MSENMIGRVFNNRYQINERIGVGGMAEVYRAQDNVLGRIVAVKVMLPQYAADTNFTQRFRQEAAAAANLQSPYIVNVYDWGQDEGTYFIVMEYVRGSDLKTAINQRGAINQRKVAEIGSQVCQALTVAHNMDIIHRDIKPQNIMVQPDGNVKVMDFGIARAKNSTNDKTGSVLGTAHYISPEQAQGKDLTASSDIYSLGVVLYEAATGKLPFDGPDAISVAMKQVQDTPIPPREINPDIDPTLEAIILKAMSKNPTERFATVKEMRTALNDYLAGRQVAFDNGFTSQETQLMGGVAPVIAGAGAGMAAGAAMGGIPDGTAVMQPVGGQTSQSATKQNNFNSNSNVKKSNGKKIGIGIGVAVAVIAIIAICFFAFGNNNASEELIEVPDVTSMSLDEAKAALLAEGFTTGNVTQQYSDKVDSGKVISQDPTAKTKKAKGTSINLVVSQGSQEIEVPDLSGMTADEAKKTLQASGLKYQAGTAEYSNTVDKDKVVRQDVAAGSKVAKDTVVTYYLSLGSEGSSVPDVVGQSRSAATATLNNAGFYVTVDTQYSSSVPEGNVISQSPSAGSTLKAEGTVNIVVSKGAETSEVPSVVGQSEGSAQTTLSNAGFQVTTEYSASSSVDSGYVISQTPNGGTELAPGKTVHLVISTGSSSSSSTTGGSTTGGGTSGGSTTGGGTSGGSTTGGGTSGGSTTGGGNTYR